MDTAELSTLIKTRRSIRVFQDKPVPEALLMQAVETATWAPNGGNAQNWRFFIILDKKVMNAIADAIDARQDTMMSWPEMANSGPPPRSNLLRRTPALIVVTTARSLQSTDDLYAKLIQPNLEKKPGFGALQDVVIAKRAKTDPKAKEMFDGLQIVNGRIQSTSAAVAYLMLVLHQMGLGTLWMTGPLYAKADIEKALKLPAGMDVVTMIPVGYPAESPTRDRKPVSEICQVIK
ncbi:MAG TPA: nitroreductase family protein [Dehalococcoidales bacterium]|jgi:nitroreductase|nr:nitroreductase family protein [Dehalococcoidales bacterium]